MWKGAYVFFCTYRLNYGCGVEELFFNSTNSKFSNPNFTRSNNRTPISAHVKKESNFTRKYADPATPTQRYSYKQGCGVGVSGVACFRAESEYFL